jgi:phospholipid/cholesterol/gamma-HCH transport system substrate-binding protein
MHEIPRVVLAGIGMAAALLVFGTSVVVLAYGQGAYDDGYHVTAVFPRSSQGLYTDGGSMVKLRGLDIGTVDAIELLPDGRAEITLFLDADIRVADTAVASIEPLSVFGPKFVHIDPGEHERSGPYLADGDEIAFTAAPVELTDVLDGATAVLNEVDPQELVSIVDAVAEGVDGLGLLIGAGIEAGATLVGVAADHVEDTRQFLTDLATVATTAAGSTHAALSTVSDLRTLLATVNEHPDDVGVLLEQTVAISNRFAALLDDNRHEFGVTIESIAQLIHGVYEQSEHIPDLIDLIGTFFGRLSDVIRLPGPEGTTLAGLRGFISLDLCLVYGICP